MMPTDTPARLLWEAENELRAGRLVGRSHPATDQDHSAPTSGREVISVLDRNIMARHTANCRRFTSVSESARIPGATPQPGGLIERLREALVLHQIVLQSWAHIEMSKNILYARPYTVLAL